MQEFVFDGPLVVDNLGTELNGDYTAGDLNLREAILLANEFDSISGVDVIEFSPGLIGQIIATDGAASIEVPATLPVNRRGYEITSDLIIRDPAAHRDDVEGHEVLTILGNGESSIFDVRADVAVTFEGLRLANAGWFSGAIYAVGADITLTNVVIEDNETRAVGLERGTLTIRDSVIRNNRTTGSGAGIQSSGGDIEITRSVITQNESVRGNASYGGGISVQEASLTIDRSEISGNVATTQGGGIYLASGASASIHYTTISSNTATDDVGGGLFSQPTSTLDLQNVTIAENTAGRQAGGLYLLGPTTLTNTLLGGNDAPSAADGRGTVTASHSLSQSPGFLPGGNGNLVAHPHLGPLADNGGPTRTHQIRPGSPAMDAGVAGLAIVDQRGQSLVDISSIGTGIPDIGAYEIQSVGSSRFNYAVQDQSQFGPGAALTYGFGFDDGRAASTISTDPKFLGFTFDTGNLKAGKITSGKIRKKNKYGGEINADFSGKLGFDLGFYVNSGSLDVAFQGDHSYVVDVNTDDSGLRGASISSFVSIDDGSLYTVSPKVGAYVDLVMQLEAEVSATGCFIGCATKDFIDLDFDKTVELFSMNRQMEDFFGRSMFFAVGEVFVRAGDDYVDANGGVFARGDNGMFYDLADKSSPIEFYELKNGSYEVLQRAPVVPFLDGDIRYVSVQLIVENALNAARTADEFKRIINEQLEKRKAAQKVEEARGQRNQASQDLNRLHAERDTAIAARDNADTAGAWLQQQRRIEQLDSDIPDAEDRVIEADRKQKRVEEEFDRNNKAKNGKRRLKSPTQFIQVEFSEADGSLLGAQADLVVGVGVSTPLGNVGLSKRVGGMQVTMPDINLGTNQSAADGSLMASTDSFPKGSELDAKRQLANLQIDMASLLGAYFGLPLGQYNVSLGPLSLDVTTVSYDFGPQLNVTQDVKAEPVIEGLTYQFFTVGTGDSLDHDNDPTTPDLQAGNVPGSPFAIDVEIDGVLFENRTEISFQPGQDVRVLESSEPILVVPVMNMDTRITNEIGLQVALKGEFEAFALALSAFGHQVVSVDPLLSHKHTLGKVDLGSVFERTFEIDNPQAVEMASFTLFDTEQNGRTAATALQPVAKEETPNRTYFRESMPANEHVFIRVDMLEPKSGPGGQDQFYAELIVTPLEGEIPQTLQVTDDRLTVTPAGNGYRIAGFTHEMLSDSSFITFAIRFDSAGTNKFRTQRLGDRLVHQQTTVTENVASIDDSIIDEISAATVLTTDIDDDGISSRATDGLLLTRYLEGKRGTDLISDVIGENASRTSASSIVAYIEGPLTYQVTVGGTTTGSLDFDGNGHTNGIDAKLFRRYLDGLRGAELVDRAIGRNAVRTTGAEIVEFIERGRSTATRNDSQFDLIEQTTEDIFDVARALDYSAAKEGSTAYSAYTPSASGSVHEYKLHRYRNWATFTEVYYQSIERENLLSIEVEHNPTEFARRRDDLLETDEDNNGVPDVLENGELDDDLINRTYQARLGVSEPLFVKAPDGVGHKFQLLTGHKFASVTIDRRVGGNLLLGDEFDLFLYRNGEWQFEATISEQEHAVRDGYLVYEFDRPIDRFQIYGTKPLDDQPGSEANQADIELLVATGVKLINPNRVAEKPRLQVRRIANRRTVTAPEPILVGDTPHAEEELTSEIRISRDRQDVVVETPTGTSELQMVATSELRLQGNDSTDDIFLVDGAGGPIRSRLSIDGGFRSDEIRFVAAGTELNLADDEHEISGVELIDTRGAGRNALIINVDVVRSNDPVTRTLRVIRNSDDKFVRRAGWKRDGEQVEEGLIWKRWIQQDALLLLATDDASAGAVAVQQPESSANHRQTDQFFALTQDDDEDLFGIV